MSPNYHYHKVTYLQGTIPLHARNCRRMNSLEIALQWLNTIVQGQPGWSRRSTPYNEASCRSCVVRAHHKHRQQLLNNEWLVQNAWMRWSECGKRRQVVLFARQNAISIAEQTHAFRVRLLNRRQAVPISHREIVHDSALLITNWVLNYYRSTQENSAARS